MPSLIAAGLQTSGATENNLPLNQTNYANVDSIAAGATANVRVYGAAGPGTQYASVKGGAETILPSSTIIAVPYGSDNVVAYSNGQYVVRNTLPEVMADNAIPVGGVNVVGAGTPTLPTVTLIVVSGYVVGATWTGDNALSAVPTFTITDPTGHNAQIAGTGVEAGKLTGIQVLNSGDGNYSSTPTVTATGGISSGVSGGGTGVGGNGGRFYTTGPSTL